MAEHSTRLEATLETCRRWYTTCLEERKIAWETERRNVGKFEQIRRVAILKAENKFAKPVHSHILHNIAKDLDNAFQAFFQRVQAGETPSYPRFKGYNRFNSFGFHEYRNGFKIDGRRLKMWNIGRVPVRWHRAYEGKIKTARIVCKADGWYVPLSCEISEPIKLPETGSTVGIDVGLSALVITSDAEQVAPPKHYRKMQAKFRRQERRIARRKKGSKRRRRAVRILAQQHQIVQWQRRDCLNKIVFGLVQRHDRIAVEDLKINNMVKNRHLAKSILDAGWGYFREHLAFKAACAGREDLTLKDRVYSCESCGLRMGRDVNAAINIRDKAFPAGRTGRAASSVIAGLAREAVGS